MTTLTIPCRSAKGLPIEPSQNTLLAELGSLSLEFTRLTQLTGDFRFFDAIQRVTNNLEYAQLKTKAPGLWPVLVDARDLTFGDNRFTLGGMADSTYEYLPKEHLLLGAQSKQYQRMYEAAIESIKAELLFRPLTKDSWDILLSGSSHATSSGQLLLEPQGQHLTCFVGGMVGLAARIFDRPEELLIARKLVDGCIWAYDLMPTGLMPEVFGIVVCDDKYDCPWDEEKWYREVLRVGAKHGFLNKDKDEHKSALELVEQMRLQPGLTEVSDARYILRYVATPYDNTTNCI
jgi:mannosyl-oligosaccharide alpha-1,2-mannosidase